MVDTSVWSEHFRNTNPMLVDLARNDKVLIHPLVIAELACGTPPEPRQQTLGDLGHLVPVVEATFTEVRELIEREKLFGQGCGFVDMALLASTLITPGARLWTLDKRLFVLAKRFGVCYTPVFH
ncbi:MAG: VapC toxin family PIN domain ribonuclease [Rhodoferax sp.]|nr:VapC toxin family PIN domain ribonuclease [Rhodoferax sp.]